jgi:hypothetical protein
MEKVCEILWEKNENGKNMTLIMCINEPLISEINNTVIFNELNVNLSKLSKNSSLENKTNEVIVNNINKTLAINNVSNSTTTFSPAPSVAPSVTPSVTPSVEPSVEPSVTPSPLVIPSQPYAPSPFHEKEQIEIVLNDLNIINPSPSNLTDNYEKNNSIIKINSDNTSLLILSISGGVVFIFIVFYLVNKYRKNKSVAPCPPIVINKKNNYVRKTNNNNKPKDYILEILPGTPRSALFNRVPLAKKASSTRRSCSLPRKTVRQAKLKKRVNSLPDLKKLDIERNRRKKNLPPLPLQDEPPPIPIRTERIRRLVEIKKKMHEQKKKTNKLMAI